MNYKYKYNKNLNCYQIIYREHEVIAVTHKALNAFLITDALNGR